MNVDEVALTKLLVYGTVQPGDDPNAHIRPEDAAPPSVTYSTSEYMTTGGGRFAKPSSASLVQAFFADSESVNPILAAGTTYTVSQVQAALGISGGLRIDVSQYFTGGDSADYVERAYVFGSSVFDLNDDMVFAIAADGTYSLQNVEIRPREDDFDFQSSSPVAELANSVLQPAFDPYGLIPQTVQPNGSVDTTGVRILWDNSAGSVFQDYGLMDFQSDAAFVSAETDAASIAAGAAQLAAAGAGLLLKTGYLGNINSDLLFDYFTEDGLFEFFPEDGLKVVYGTNGDDILSPASAEPHDPTVSNFLGYQIVGGDGSDTIAGSNNYDALWGGNGADELQGLGGNDTLYFDAEDTLVSGGAGRDTAIATGSNGVVLNLSNASLEVVVGTESVDQFSSGVDLAASVDSGDIFIAGGGGNDSFNLSHQLLNQLDNEMQICFNKMNGSFI